MKTDPRFLRPAEVDVLLGDASKAHNNLKWKPKVSFDGLVKKMIDSDLELAQQEKLIDDSKKKPAASR